MWACIGLFGLWGTANATDSETPSDPVRITQEPLDAPDDRNGDMAPGTVVEGDAETAVASENADRSEGDSGNTSLGDTESAHDPATNDHAEADDNPADGSAGTQSADSTQRIEQALDEPVTPLDSVAFGIEQAEYEGAEEFLDHYIRAMESAHHRYHPDLVKPLTLLGDAQFGQQRFDRALETYNRALHIRRVNDGLFAPDQVAVVYKQAAALQAMGDLEEAGNREEYAYSVLLKAHGLSSEEMLAGTYRLAEWYRESFNVFAARAMYERALRVHEANGKQSSLSALPALKGLVFTYRQERFPTYYVSDNQSSSFGAAPLPLSTRATVYTQQITINNFPAAERALQHIVRIRRDDPQSSQIEVFEAILDLADWHLMWEHFKKAHTLYEFVYTQMDELDSVDAGEYFAEPRLLHMPLPADPKPPRGGTQQPGTERARIPGFIETSFRVSTNGSAQDIEIVAADPEGLMDFRTRRSLRSSRYRPAMTNGKAIPFDNQTWRHEFEYVPRHEPEEDDA